MSFLKKIFHKKKQEPNRVADDSTVIHIHPEDSHKIWLNVQGKNNVINIGKLSPKIVGDIHISVYGDNCSVNIGDRFFTCYGVHILLGLNHENYGKITASHLKIGNNTSIEGARIITFNSHNTISVGDECMLSENIMLYNTDSHPIYDKSTGKIINYVKDMTIGRHCWLGMNVKMLKNTALPDNTIVGAQAVITKSFTQPNCIIAGMPARVVKQNVEWKRSDIRWVKGEEC